MPREKTVSSQVIYSGQVVTLRIDTVQTPDGKQATREIIEHADCIGIVPVDAEGNILMVRQFRRAAGKELLEIPAGGIDPGESPEMAVRRELQEETGYLPQKLERLGGFYLAPGYSSEYMHLYLATNLAPSPLHAEDTDEIELVKVPLAKIPGLITSGSICDSKSIAGLFLYYLKYQKDNKLKKPKS